MNKIITIILYILVVISLAFSTYNYWRINNLINTYNQKFDMAGAAIEGTGKILEDQATILRDLNTAVGILNAELVKKGIIE